MGPWPAASGGGPDGQRLRVPREVLDAISGAIAGGVSRLVVSPLDVLKIRFQVRRKTLFHQCLSAERSPWWHLWDRVRPCFKPLNIP